MALYYAGYYGVISATGVFEGEYRSVCNSGLNGISVDFFGYFAFSCGGSNFIYIYNSTLGYTGKSIEFSGAMAARYDTNYRFGICGYSNLNTIPFPR